MAENQPSETWITRIIEIIRKSPLISLCLYLVYSMYQMQIYFQKKEEKWEQRELQREKENKEIWSFYLEDVREKQRLKDIELSKKYQNDSIKQRN